MGEAVAEGAVWLLGVATRELMIFAAVGLLLGGLDDLVVDAIWLTRGLWRRQVVYRRFERASAASLAPPLKPGRMAIFVGAWDEAAVIGQMLRTALARIRHDDYLIYVATYPNDPGTNDVVAGIADSRVRLVPGFIDGPTTKAEALNRCWRAMLADEAASGMRVKAIVLHDAEDVVHPAELRVFDTLIERCSLVQLPVLPLKRVGHLGVAGSYVDEFAEAHGKQLVVREAIGAGVPSAGVGCAIARDALARVAQANGGAPFDAASLTEDYELGLRLRAFGGRGYFVRLPASPGGRLVAVEAYFPETLDAAVVQKARWMVGIALAGWDRLGWHGGLAEHWMRLRDRRAPMAALVLTAGYLAMLLALVGLATGRPPPIPDWLGWLLTVNGVLLVWRAVMRAVMVTRVRGWREGLWSIPRLFVSNIILIASARRALRLYLRPGTLRWDKTRHHFPADLPAE